MPNYFCIVLGDPTPEGKNQVEQGWYKPANHGYRDYPEPGDLILFYCTSNYKEHPQQVPGIGIVVEKNEKRKLTYTYLPLQTPLLRDELLQRVGPDEQHRLENLHIVQNFLFPLDRASFARVMDGQTIEWP